MLEERVIERCAAELRQAAERREPIAPLTGLYPDMDVKDAYQIQLVNVKAKIESGRRIIGMKIGLTSKPMQQMLGVMEPDYGHLFDDMVVPEGAGVSMSRLIQPKVEGEIAFLINKELSGPGLTAVDVLASTEGVLPAIEIIDSRIADWKIKIQDTIADNASSGMLALGGKITPVEGLDLRYVGMVMEKNGEVVSTGAGAAALGHPAWAVAWLANKLAEFGLALKPGQVVLSGSLTAALAVTAGDVVTVSFERLGVVTVRFVD